MQRFIFYPAGFSVKSPFSQQASFIYCRNLLWHCTQYPIVLLNACNDFFMSFVCKAVPNSSALLWKASPRFLKSSFLDRSYICFISSVNPNFVRDILEAFSNFPSASRPMIAWVAAICALMLTSWRCFTLEERPRDVLLSNMLCAVRPIVFSSAALVPIGASRSASITIFFKGISFLCLTRYFATQVRWCTVFQYSCIRSTMKIYNLPMELSLRVEASASMRLCVLR